MATASQIAREQAHVLLDSLPDEKVVAVRGLLEVMVEPMSSFLASVPMDDEELTPETVVALEQARASLARGEGISHDELLREFVAWRLTTANAFPSCGRPMREPTSELSTAKRHWKSCIARTVFWRRVSVMSRS